MHASEFLAVTSVARTFTRRLGTVATIAAGFFLMGCAFPARQWSSQERIEQTIHEKLPIGTTREVILKFFEQEHVYVMELLPLEKRPQHTLTVSFVTKRSFFVETSVLVVFYLDKSGKLERTSAKQELTGP